jgi:hypothetical protein
MQVIAAGSLPKVKAANWVVGGDGMMEGMNPRSRAWCLGGGVCSEEGGLGCWLVGVTAWTTARTTACRRHGIADEEAGRPM